MLSVEQISLGAGGEGQEKEAGRGGAGGDDIKICIDFAYFIIQLTIAFNHSYHTCKFDIDWISILLKISKINANFDIIAACSSSPSLLLLPFASCS